MPLAVNDLTWGVSGKALVGEAFESCPSTPRVLKRFRGRAGWYATCSSVLRQPTSLMQAINPVTQSTHAPTQPVAQVSGERFANALNRAQAPSAQYKLVEATRTPLTGGQAADAITTAYTEAYGSPPSRNTVAVLTSHWALETGRGAKMYNFNFAGIKGSGPSGMSAAYKTREGWGENAVKIVDRFRAYGSAAEGAADYLSLLERRYPEALESAKQGDPEAFVSNLKRRRYFTGNEQAYTRSVASMTRTALAESPAALSASGVGEGRTSMMFASLELHEPPRTMGSGALFDSAQERFAPVPLPLDGMSAVADEVSRAALRILTEAPDRQGNAAQRGPLDRGMTTDFEHRHEMETRRG